MSPVCSLAARANVLEHKESAGTRRWRGGIAGTLKGSVERFATNVFSANQVNSVQINVV